MPTPGEAQIEITPVDDGSIEIPTNDKDQSLAPAGSGNDKPVSAKEIADLQKELTAAKAERDAERAGRTTEANRRVAAEQAATETTHRMQSEVENRLAAQESTIDAGISSVQGEIETLRSLAAKALEDGKWADAAKAQEDMADAKLRMREFKYQKDQITRYREQAKNQPPPKVEATAPAGNTKTEAWIAAHPRFNSDRDYNARAMQGHYAAIAQKIPLESDRYFEMIEQFTGDREMPNDNDKDTGGGGKQPQTHDDLGSEVAPVSRRAAPATGDTRRQANVIKLSGDEVEAADAMFGEPGTPMYIENKADRYRYWHTQKQRLRSEGRLG